MKTIESSSNFVAQEAQLVFGTFLLNGQEFAIEMFDLQEVVNAPKQLQKMPLSPNYLRGLFNLRGQVLPVIDLHILLLAHANETTTQVTTRMVVLRRGSACLGILFDEIGEIVRVAPQELIKVEQRSADSRIPKIPVKAVLCMNAGERVIQVLDLSAILSIQNIPLLEKTRIRGGAEEFQASRMGDLYREKLVGFTVGSCKMAIEMKCILAIVESSGKKPSPRKSRLCESVVMFVDRMIPVVAMSQLLNIECENASGRIMICRIGDGTIGFEVDEVTSIIPYSKEKVMPIAVLADHRSSVFHGCFTDRDGKDYIVLNEEGALSKSELIEISFAHQKLTDQQCDEQRRTIVPQVTMLTFRMGKVCGLPLIDVLEVLVCPNEFDRVPGTPDEVLGVFNLRGMPVSVVDPHKLFDLPPAAYCMDAKLLVFEHEKRKIAMRVDSVEGIVSVSKGDRDELPTLFFRDDQPVLQETFERGVNVISNGVKTVVLILTADQIVKRLAAALTA